MGLLLVQSQTPLSVLGLLDNGPWLINFYAPWCGFCRRLEPTYEEVGQYFSSLESPIRIARLDATTHLKAGRFFHIDGFPTIKLPAVKSLDNITAFEATSALVQNDPFFVLVGYRDPLLGVAYGKVAQQYRLLIWFFSVPSTNAIPKKYAHLLQHAEQAHRGLIVFKDGDGLVFPGLPSFPEAETYSFMERHLREWILRERYPVFIETRVVDLWEIGTVELLLKEQRENVADDDNRAGIEYINDKDKNQRDTIPYRLIALFLLNPPSSHDAVSLQFKEFGRNLAQQRVPELVRHYQFAWIDQALDVLSNLAMVHLSVPSLIVVDPVTRVIYLNPNQTVVNGLFTLEPKVVLSFLMAVVDGGVPVTIFDVMQIELPQSVDKPRSPGVII
ncbi:hypothetical protein FBUS_04838 [Fasciolopsis buskii]|uniref:Thioredoxin domain-containing protein n=2 Tax=Fasciolopsis buskii TaxID=27845 RepID=A0A8E0S7H4_9TREM|nr:hypothetical protein FBUS_04838 [Fasciolopsis buski]